MWLPLVGGTLLLVVAWFVWGLQGMGFAVVDTETTGLFPTDRICELGVVLIDNAGQVELVVDTLVNPQRDVASDGPQHREAEQFHGITSTQVIHAPTFADLAPWLLHHLSGRVVLAHNAWFDLRFLDREFTRAGYRFPGPLAVWDTMRMSGAMLGVHSLAQAAMTLNLVWPGDAHRAAVDAQMTWAVGSRLWSMLPSGVGAAGTGWTTRAENGRIGVDFAEFELLDLAALAAQYGPVDAAPVEPRWVARHHADEEAARVDGYLGRLMSHLPAGSLTVTDADPAAAGAYLDLLDRAIADRLLTLDEAEQLAGLARELGLRGDHVQTLHRRYLDVLVDVAHADGVVTELEATELNRVADLLGLARADWRAAQPRLDAAHGPVLPGRALSLQVGDAVCFTGAMSCPRAELVEMCHDVGLVPGGLTKKTVVLVVADPNTQSGKAKKARQYGTMVVSEQVFRDAVAALG